MFKTNKINKNDVSWDPTSSTVPWEFQVLLNGFMGQPDSRTMNPGFIFIFQFSEWKIKYKTSCHVFYFSFRKLENKKNIQKINTRRAFWMENKIQEYFIFLSENWSCILFSIQKTGLAFHFPFRKLVLYFIFHLKNSSCIYYWKHYVSHHYSCTNLCIT